MLRSDGLVLLPFTFLVVLVRTPSCIMLWNSPNYLEFLEKMGGTMFTITMLISCFMGFAIVLALSCSF